MIDERQGGVEPAERRFDVTGLTIAAREWGRRGDLPVLAMHGWLDNAGSFDLLAPLLEGCNTVALDAAGHGFSGFRSADSGYNLWQDVGDMIDVADLLGFDRFRLIGHSRGAAIATLLAGTCPERVEQLVLIEGGLPLIGRPEDAPGTLAQALRRKRELAGRSGRVFADRDAAIAERVAGFTPVTREAAEILARRSLREVAGGHTWHCDQRLKAPSELRLTAEHVRAFVRRVEAPVLMLMAEQSAFRDWREYADIVPLFRRLDSATLPGRHHLHLEGTEAEIAARIRRFFGLG
ncbi:MAG: alpha/beta hydrolase [Gammaproteobacteria bacterium]|nr:alpha/beta hydrolase [Gammaproteobacteria bacterium]